MRKNTARFVVLEASRPSATGWRDSRSSATQEQDGSGNTQACAQLPLPSRCRDAFDSGAQGRRGLRRAAAGGLPLKPTPVLRPLATEHSPPTALAIPSRFWLVSSEVAHWARGMPGQRDVDPQGAVHLYSAVAESDPDHFRRSVPPCRPRSSEETCLRLGHGFCSRRWVSIRPTSIEETC